MAQLSGQSPVKEILRLGGGGQGFPGQPSPPQPTVATHCNNATALHAEQAQRDYSQNLDTLKNSFGKAFNNQT